jgi:toxin ParE1/3/4
MTNIGRTCGTNWRSTSLRGRRAAHDTFQFLATTPLVGVLYELPHLRLQNLRKFPVQGFEHHLVFYASHKDRIEIVRVLHAKRDLETAL